MNDFKYEDSVGIEKYRTDLNLSYNVALNHCLNNKNLKAFKYKGKWRIPLFTYKKLKEEHYKYETLIKECYTVPEVVNIINKTRTFTHKLISEGDIPGGFMYRGKWYVNKSSLYKWMKLKNLDLLDSAITLNELCEKFNLSINVIRKYINENDIGAFKDNKIWYIPNDKIGEIERGLNNKIKLVSGEYYSLSDVQKKFQVSKNNAKNIATKHFQENKLRISNRSYYDKKIVDKYYKSLNKLERNPSLINEYYSIKDIENFMKITNTGVLNLLKREKNIKVLKRYNKMYIDKISFNKFFNNHPISKSYTLNEVMELLNLSRFRITEMIKDKKLIGAIKENRTWYIPKNQNQEFINDYIYYNKKMKLSLTISELSKEFKMSRGSISKLRYNGVFKNAFFHNEIWYIPDEDIKEFHKLNESLKDTLSTVEVAEKFGFKSNTSVSTLILDNEFPNAFKYNREWRIPLKDLKVYEKKREQRNTKIIFNNEIAIQTMQEIIKEYGYPEKFRNTILLFVKHTKIFLNTTESNEFNKRFQFNIYVNFLKKLYSVIDKELYLLGEKELDKLFESGTIFTSPELKILNKFYKYICAEKGIENDFVLTQVNDSKRNLKSHNTDIYTPDEFTKIYKHVVDINLHLNSALKHAYIANMWGYVTLHCTTFIRGNDLLSESLQIDLKVLNIKDFEWFRCNRLSEDQIEIVIKQLYFYFKNKKSSKTGELVTFLVEESLREPLAYAMIISELHKQMNKKDYFFYTFYSRNLNTRSISGKKTHQHFFNKFDHFSNFEFKTLKMNRSIGTYLFNSITDGPVGKSDLALFLTQKSRSHKSGDTTSLYVQTTNNDGPINEVSYNLSKRGSFGWLYTTLLDFILENNNMPSKSKTEIVSLMQESIKPINVERHAEFGLNYINKSQNIIYKNDKEKILSTIKKQQLNIINLLVDFGVEEIKSIVYKLSKGLMPSKIEHAQCLMSNNCPYPNQNNCLQCEFVIPEKMILIQLNSELDNIITNISKESNHLLLRKHSAILIKLLLILKEARMVGNDEIINAYISLSTLREKLNDVSEKLYLKGMG